MRLIDADALIKELNNRGIEYNPIINAVITMQPTAYDVDKVVGELIKEEMYDCVPSYRKGIEDAIAIVKRGGINDL